MREKVEHELNRLEKAVLSKTNTSEWATPIVPILKKNNQVRICGDYKVTVNPAPKVDHYPPSKPRDIFAALAGDVKFTKLDLRQAYLQCEVDEETKGLKYSQRFVQNEQTRIRNCFFTIHMAKKDGANSARNTILLLHS